MSLGEKKKTSNGLNCPQPNTNPIGRVLVSADKPRLHYTNAAAEAFFPPLVPLPIPLAPVALRAARIAS